MEYPSNPGRRDKKTFFATNVYRPGAGGDNGGNPRNPGKNKTTRPLHPPQRPPPDLPYNIPTNTKPVLPRTGETGGPTGSTLYLNDTSTVMSEITMFTAAAPDLLHHKLPVMRPQEERDTIDKEPPPPFSNMNQPHVEKTTRRGIRTVAAAQGKVTESYVQVREPHQEDASLARAAHAGWDQRLFQPGDDAAETAKSQLPSWEDKAPVHNTDNPSCQLSTNRANAETAIALPRDSNWETNGMAGQEVSNKPSSSSAPSSRKPKLKASVLPIQEPSLPGAALMVRKAAEMYSSSGSGGDMPHIASPPTQANLRENVAPPVEMPRRSSSELGEYNRVVSNVMRNPKMTASKAFLREPPVVAEEPMPVTNLARQISAGQGPPTPPNRDKPLGNVSGAPPLPSSQRGRHVVVPLKVSIQPVREPSLEGIEKGANGKSSAYAGDKYNKHKFTRNSNEQERDKPTVARRPVGRGVTVAQYSIAASEIKVREPDEASVEHSIQEENQRSNKNGQIVPPLCRPRPEQTLDYFDRPEGSGLRHRRSASDPDNVLDMEPPKFEAEDEDYYRSEPAMTFNHVVPPRRTSHNQTLEVSHELPLFGGARATKSLISDDDDASDKALVPSEKHPLGAPALVTTPSLPSVTEPSLDGASPHGRRLAETVVPPTISMGEKGNKPRSPRKKRSSSSAESGLSFSTVGSGDSIRIVSFDAAKTPSQRSMRSMPSTRRLSSAVYNAQDGVCRDWACNQCSYVNGQCDDRCAVCGMVQQHTPGDVASPSQSRPSLHQWRSSRRVLRSSIVLRPSVEGDGAWLCLTCTYMNQNALHLSCEICGEPRSKSDEKALKLLQDEQADERNQGDSQLVDELESKVREKEHILDLLGQQGTILSELREMEAFSESNYPDDVARFQKQVAEKGEVLDKIRQELARALKKDQEEQEVLSREQNNRRSEMLDATGVASLADLTNDASHPASSEALEWMAQQRMLDEWRSQVEARALQLEEMRLQQEEVLLEYQARNN